LQDTQRRSRRRSSGGILILIFGVSLGIALGLIIGWVIAPVSWTPNVDDVQAIADSYSLNSDLSIARTRLRGLTTEDQARVFKRLISDNTTHNRTAEATRANALAQALHLPIDQVSSDTFAPFSLVPVVIVGAIIFVGLAVIAGGIFIRGVAPQLRTPRENDDTKPQATQAPEEPGDFAAPPPASVPKPSSALGRHMATYNSGVDNFDTSFPLETSRLGFLGECGIGVSETLDDGLPDKVTAFDLWLFDKTDVRTVTQIIMSEHAFNDPSLRAKLQTKGDAVLAAKGRVLALETQSLKIQARIQDIIYASNARFPQNSYFQKLVVEIASYVK
jgi:hypothetical protein